ncbi:phosphatidate cytidylyltransferase [Glutamicibacter uratoxydans]|uniref:phosphatidate cytidylyltransferase n=1 Tax=Glutamicibacter uratoxydans TaxID=43667 RepID=UPI003D6F5BF3
MSDLPEPAAETGKPAAAAAQAETPPLTRRQLRQVAQQAEAAKPSKAGRNLPAAISVGLLMLGAVLVGLFWFPLALLAMVVLLAALGSWEVARATSQARVHVPVLPLYFAALLLPGAAYFGGLEALGFAYAGSLLVIVLSRILEGLKNAAPSIMASIFIISWIPLLLSFAILLLADENGTWLIATALLLVVANDTFGYIVGVLFGKHPMAPKISPKKSWEGFAGSVAGAIVIGVLAAHYVLDMPWWAGSILAVFTVIAATTGDLSESMVKRELGIKDMSNLLPGHGGVMDRLDSVLFAIPLVYLVSHLMTWSASLS